METIGIASMRPETLTWEKALRLFMLRCRSLNLTPATQALYKIRLDIWQGWLKDNGSPNPTETKAEHIRAYLEAMKARGWKDETLDSAFRILRTLFKWLEREGFLFSNPMAKIDRPRREKTLIRPFSEDQLRAFLGAINTKTPIGSRDFALCVLLSDTGVRISEALSIRLQDMDFGERIIRIKGKGRRERLLPIGQTVERALLDWIKRRGEIPGMDFLFCNRFGQPLRKRTVCDALHEYGAKAGIEGVRCSAHSLRHTFAISYLRGNGDLLTLQKILGHSTLEMTRRYAAVLDLDVIKRHREASPMDRMGPLSNERKRVRLS